MRRHVDARVKPGHDGIGGRVVTKRETIVRMSEDEAKAAIKRGQSRGDFRAVGKLTHAEIERQAADDPEERGWDWAGASLELPKPKVGIHIKLDADVIEYFKKDGSGYQTRINAALKSFVKHASTRSGRERLRPPPAVRRAGDKSLSIKPHSC